MINPINAYVYFVILYTIYLAGCVQRARQWWMSVSAVRPTLPFCDAIRSNNNSTAYVKRQCYIHLFAVAVAVAISLPLRLFASAMSVCICIRAILNPLASSGGICQ